ncbi:hypothetical protein E3U55_08705 [Filobacillus milosensis]|uniref:Uncharacterized protein n=1 Tax=Filobacillus milosensis TaxID=94137 RepID=A0A4Y8IKB1_9BACI|nr:hypothetical protein [Filobacillus milosensis]TFB21384.1 hypothetical protein E3U55_08705 [Filobacillus milosensis]
MTLKMSNDGLKRSKDFIMNEGRKLEQEIYRFEFEGGTKEAVISALEEYQNSDGGFSGYGEGDWDESNAMDTNMAFQTLVHIGATGDEPVVQKAVKYILSTYDFELDYWHQNPTNQPVGETMLNELWANPGAELIGYLYDYQKLVDNEFLNHVTEVAIKKLQYLTKAGWFPTLCFLRLSERLDEPRREQVLIYIKSIILDVVETNPEVWEKFYYPKPYWYAPTPGSPLYPMLHEDAIACLEHEINQQTEQGNFPLNWDAGEGEAAWKSIWTMDILIALNKYDMIEVGEEVSQ